MDAHANDYAEATRTVRTSVGIETPPTILGVIDAGWMRYVTDLTG